MTNKHGAKTPCIILVISIFKYAKSNTQQFFIADSDTVAENVDEGVSRKMIAFDENLMMVKVYFEKGAAGTVHHHHHTQITYIEKGIFEVMINNEKKVLGAGDSFFIPSNILHGVICIEQGVLIDSFSPARKDFLK